MGKHRREDWDLRGGRHRKPPALMSPKGFKGTHRRRGVFSRLFGG
jgi:hypothetical protein